MIGLKRDLFPEFSSWLGNLSWAVSRISGCLGVIVREDSGPDVSIARIAAGETVGEFLDDKKSLAEIRPWLLAEILH
jgi:hypothetical protein